MYKKFISVDKYQMNDQVVFRLYKLKKNLDSIIVYYLKESKLFLIHLWYERNQY